MSTSRTHGSSGTTRVAIRIAWTFTLVLSIGIAPVTGSAQSIAAQPDRAAFPPPVQQAPKAPGLALVAGLVVPGLGYLYTGHRWLGGVAFGAAAGAVMTGVLSTRTRILCAAALVDGRCPDDRVHSMTEEHHVMGRTVLAAAVVSAGTALHAFLLARRSGAALTADDATDPARPGFVAPAIEWQGERVSVSLLRFVF
ncbi:MAG: hypothetical protein L0271_00985 [Gemmatimonadetes bacterium]|nr:hypothetical protein [Gemmatimonadota bacterium]